MTELTVLDRIAAEAARLFEAGVVETVREAIEAACERLGLDGPRPSGGRVRQHLQARSMQSLGVEGYRAQVAGLYQVAEQLMTFLVEAMDDVEPVLVGRAARGHVDGDGSMHIRLYTERPIGSIAEVLVTQGYDEPRFETAQTRHGRLSRIRIVEEQQEIVLTRCLPAMRPGSGRNLFTGRPVETASLDEVRQMAAERD